MRPRGSQYPIGGSAPIWSLPSNAFSKIDFWVAYDVENALVATRIENKQTALNMAINFESLFYKIKIGK